MTRNAAFRFRSAVFYFAQLIGSARKWMPVTWQPRPAKKRAFSVAASVEEGASDPVAHAEDGHLRPAGVSGCLAGVGDFKRAAEDPAKGDDDG